MQPLISIIIPVYNAAQYLTQCLESISNQVDTDFELILVDDGSTDGCGKILDDYVNDSVNANVCIKVHHQPNAGVSAARNKGIELATGEYITFVDADDWLAPDYIQAMKTLVKKADFIAVGMYDWMSERECVKVQNATADLYNLNDDSQLLTLIRCKRLTGPWCKLYDASIIRKYNLQFNTEICFGEDKEFVTNYISHCNSAYVSDYCGYYYRVDVAGSLSRKVHKERYLTEYRIWEIWYASILRRGIECRPLNEHLAHELYYIVSDSIVGANKHGYSIPRLTSDGKGFLKVNSRYIDDANVLRKYLITHNYFQLARWINKIKNL